MIRLFDIADVNKSASAFNREKLAWLNQQHLMHAPVARLIEPLRWQLEQLRIEIDDEAKLAHIVLAQRERSKTLKEMAENSAFFFKRPASYDEKAVRKHVTTEALAVLNEVPGELERLPVWSAPAIHEFLSATAAAKDVALGKLAQPIRLAVCGGTVSPPIDATLEILGREETLSRLRQAIERWGRS